MSENKKTGSLVSTLELSSVGMYKRKSQILGVSGTDEESLDVSSGNIQALEQAERKNKIILDNKSLPFFPGRILHPVVVKLRHFLLLGTVIILIVLAVFIYTGTYVSLEPTPPKSNQPDINVLLVGDSLLTVAYEKYDLQGKLQSRFRTTTITLHNHAIESSTIKRIADTIEQAANSLTPQTTYDVAFIYWDSDNSSENENGMTSDQITIKRRDYTSYLIYVIRILRQANIPYIAVAGPGIFLESNNFLFLNPPYLAGKESQLDDYREINRKTAMKLSVDYIDIRTHFQKKIPNYWLLPRYYITQDGEHPNKRGTQIMADVFAYQLQLWLQVPDYIQ